MNEGMDFRVFAAIFFSCALLIAMIATAFVYLGGVTSTMFENIVLVGMVVLMAFGTFSLFRRKAFMQPNKIQVSSLIFLGNAFMMLAIVAIALHD